MSLDLIVTNFFETCTATCLPRAVARSPQLTPSMLPRRESAQTSRTERRRLKRRPRAHTRKRQGSNLQWALPQLDARSVCRFSIPSRRLFSFPRPVTEEAISAHHTRLHNGIRQGPRQARQGHPRPRPYRYVHLAEQRQSSIVRREKESGKSLLERGGARTWEKTFWTTRTRPWRIARLAEQITDASFATQALAVVLPRSALSSWTTLPVPSSVTSRVPVRFSRPCRRCASASINFNH